MVSLQDNNNTIYPMVYEEGYIHRENRLSLINRFEFVSCLSMKDFKNNKQTKIIQDQDANRIKYTIFVQIINYIINMVLKYYLNNVH